MTSQPFHDRPGKIWFDGKMLEWRDANIHLLSHALHYAGSVFEGLRVYDGEIFKLKEHTQRLFDSAHMLGYPLPYNLQQLMEATTAIVREQKITNGYVRPIAWRGSEAMGVAAQRNKIHVAIACWEWPSYFDPEARANGIRITTAKWRRPDPLTAPAKSKTSSLYA